MRRFVVLLVAMFAFGATLSAQQRSEQLLDKGWRFTRTDSEEHSRVGFDDSKWQQVRVPHDWAIYGPFSINNDRQNVAITQDGQKEAMEHAGRTGGLPFVGVGWYRLSFEAPDFTEGKRAIIIFDGAMSQARVFVNGHEVGFWPYGYNSFHFDITDYMNRSGKNELAVRLENATDSSRWYPGAGIYRNVHLLVVEDVHIPVWGTQLTTPVVKEHIARIELRTQVVRPEVVAEPLRLVTEIKDQHGNVVALAENGVSRYDSNCFEQEFDVESPELWSVESPVLYTAESKLFMGDVLKDEYTTRFGIRTIEIKPDEGMFINGVMTKFKGVCNHHDLGPLGAAVNDAAIRRQIRIESIDNFLALADTFAVYRLEYPLEVRDEVVNKALIRNARGARFDFDFDNTTDSLLYCTELVAKSINDALGEDLVKPTKMVLEKTCFSLDDLTTHCILIK